MPKLVFIDTHFAGQVYHLIKEKTTVGRADDNVLVVRHPSVSAKHCEILVNGEEVIVRDLDSRNGTLADGRKLKNQQTAVKSGNVIRFGAVEARIEIEPPTGEGEATQITAVRAHERAVRKQRKAEQNPLPTDPSMKLESADVEEEAEQTILMPRSPASAGAGLEKAGEAEQPQPVKLARWLVAAVVVGGLVLLAWWLRGKK